MTVKLDMQIEVLDGHAFHKEMEKGRVSCAKEDDGRCIISWQWTSSGNEIKVNTMTWRLKRAPLIKCWCNNFQASLAGHSCSSSMLVIHAAYS